MSINTSLNREINTFSLVRFTLPSIIMLIFMSFYTIVDGIFVSRLIGTNAFSAINIIFPILSVSIALGIMFGTGTSAIVSMKLGQGKQNEANRNLTFVVLFTVTLGIVISIFLYTFLEKIIVLLGANENIYKYCYSYALPIIIFIPANILQCLFESLFVAKGKPHVGLIVIILGGISNIVFDYLFIVVFKIGISGAAIATGIGWCIPSIYGLLYFAIDKKSALHFVKPKIEWNVLWKVITNGSSEMVSNISTGITTFLFNIILMHFLGEDGVAAIAIILYLDFLLVAISIGYSVGISPLISFNYGCKNHDNLKRLYKLSSKFCAVIGIFITLITIIFSKELAGIFTEKGTHVYNLAVTGLNIYSFGYLFKGFNIFSSAMFTALNNGKISAILSFMRTLVLLTLSLLTLSALFGVSGIWFASPFTEVFAFLICVFFIMKFKNYYHYL